MKASTCCFRIKYCRREPGRESLYSNEGYEPNDFERIRSLLISKYYSAPYSVTSLDNYISDDETIESLNGRLNELLRRIACDLGNIIRVEKSEPIYDGSGLNSWIVIIYFEFIEPIEYIPRFDDFYGIGMVCRSYEDESSFSFFDVKGILYQLEKKDAKLKLGDIVVFKTHRQIIEQGADIIEKTVPFEEEDDEEYELEDYGLENFELISNLPLKKLSYSPLIEEQERIQDEAFWKRKPAQVKYSISPEFVLFSELDRFTTQGRTRGFNHSIRSLTYSLTNGTIYLYDDYWRCVFCSSLGESVLLQNALLPPVTEASLTSYTTLNNKCSEIWEYVNNLKIDNIFSTYQIIVTDSRIVNHSDERFRQYTPSIETEDKYICGLFPLDLRGYDWIYTDGDEELTRQHDTQAENKAIQSALKKYDKYEHFSYLLHEDLIPSQQRVILQREVNRFWPLNYFENLLSNIPSQNLTEFINEYNNRRLYYRDVILDYINTE